MRGTSFSTDRVASSGLEQGKWQIVANSGKWWQGQMLKHHGLLPKGYPAQLNRHLGSDCSNKAKAELILWVQQNDICTTCSHMHLNAPIHMFEYVRVDVYTSVFCQMCLPAGCSSLVLPLKLPESKREVT